MSKQPHPPLAPNAARSSVDVRPSESSLPRPGRRCFLSIAAGLVSVALASTPTAALAHTQPSVEEPGEAMSPPQSDVGPRLQPPASDDTTPFVDSTSGTADTGHRYGPVVHIINELESSELGVLKLARHRSSEIVADGAVQLTTYEEICTAPCGVVVDVRERPLFYFVRDGEPVSYKFRLDDVDEVTLSVRPVRGGMHFAGFVLTGLMVLPAGIPLLVLSRARISIAEGSPSSRQEFRRLRLART